LRRMPTLKALKQQRMPLRLLPMWQERWLRMQSLCIRKAKTP